MSSYSSGMRVFRGCRALLAPAKSAAAEVATANKSTTATKSKPKPKPRAKTTNPGSSSLEPKRALAKPTGILKPGPISPALQTFLGMPEASRADAVKQIWSHVKLHNLQNPADKRQIYCDEKLKALFDGKDKIGFLEIGKLLACHFVKST
ncbi:Upstream activation factor subunit spp27 [Morella rubra]|uniref:Upstream activation factor subunit spp27 n=1 Tax=Morella rubra TaxID=262757 RepID=A0A6A1WIC0_9ROSI|nr:Upstream activation factor subunit spp27 [Morella rubra]